jgi:hypothetical protein
MIPVFRSSLFQIHKSHGIGYGMNSVSTAASKKLGVTCDGRGKARFIRFGRTLSLSLGTNVAELRHKQDDLALCDNCGTYIYLPPDEMVCVANAASPQGLGRAGTRV